MNHQMAVVRRVNGISSCVNRDANHPIFASSERLSSSYFVHFIHFVSLVKAKGKDRTHVAAHSRLIRNKNSEFETKWRKKWRRWKRRGKFRSSFCTSGARNGENPTESEWRTSRVWGKKTTKMPNIPAADKWISRGNKIAADHIRPDRHFPGYTRTKRRRPKNAQPPKESAGRCPDPIASTFSISFADRHFWPQEPTEYLDISRKK